MIYMWALVACKSKNLIVTPLLGAKSDFTFGFSVVDLIQP